MRSLGACSANFSAQVIQRHRAAVASNLKTILCSFEIDVPSVIKRLLQATLDASDAMDAVWFSLRVMRLCSLACAQQRQPFAHEKLNDPEPLLTTAQCQHAVMRVALRYLSVHTKSAAIFTLGPTLSGVVEYLTRLLGNSPCVAPAQMRGALAYLVEQVILPTTRFSTLCIPIWHQRVAT
jgi:hypothetical protein